MRISIRGLRVALRIGRIFKVVQWPLNPRVISYDAVVLTGVSHHFFKSKLASKAVVQYYESGLSEDPRTPGGIHPEC